MIYEGKEYVEVAPQYAKKGDLAHITEVNGTKCDDYRFICHVDGGDFIFDEKLSVGWCFVIRSDTFKTYRYVKDVEEFLSAANVKDDDLFVVIDDTCAHSLSNGTIVRKSKTKASYSGMQVKVLRSNIKKFVNYKDVRRATEEDIDMARKTYNLVTQTDTVNSPSHYNQTKIEAIDIIEDVTAGYQSNVKYHIGNAIKYLIRAPFKNNTVEDLKKAVWYIQRAIEKLEGEE